MLCTHLDIREVGVSKFTLDGVFTQVMEIAEYKYTRLGSVLNL